MATAKDIMTKEVITVTTDVTIEGLARILTKHDISGAPVVDEEDIKRMAATTVGDIFKKDVVTITESATIEEIATIMSEKNVHHLPVIKKGKLAGIVGKKDIVKAIAKGER